MLLIFLSQLEKNNLLFIIIYLTPKKRGGEAFPLLGALQIFLDIIRLSFPLLKTKHIIFHKKKHFQPLFAKFDLT